MSTSKSGNACSGVCMMSTSWRDEQKPSFLSFISSFLDANSFRLSFVPISPDFIFNCGGLSIAFVFVTKWDCNNAQHIFSRAEKLKGQFAHLYIILSLPTREQHKSFVHSYLKYQMEIGKPTFVVVQEAEMGFEKMVRLAHFRAIYKQHDAKSNIKAERTKSMQTMDAFLKVVTAIPGIDNHDANALNHAIGSVEAIAKARKEFILENTDLSAQKAETLTRFLRDPKFYLGPKIN